MYLSTSSSTVQQSNAHLGYQGPGKNIGWTKEEVDLWLCFIVGVFFYCFGSASWVSSLRGTWLHQCSTEDRKIAVKGYMFFSQKWSESFFFRKNWPSPWSSICLLPCIPSSPPSHGWEDHCWICLRARVSKPPQPKRSRRIMRLFCQLWSKCRRRPMIDRKQKIGESFSLFKFIYNHNVLLGEALWPVPCRCPRHTTWLTFSSWLTDSWTTTCWKSKKNLIRRVHWLDVKAWKWKS